MIRILNVEPVGYSRDARAVLEAIGEVVEHEMDRGQLLDAIGGFDVLLVRLRHQIDRTVIDRGGRLGAICSATTGLDHIDVAYAQKQGIAIISLKGETEFLETIHATAEHTWALILALVRRLPAAVGSVAAGGWARERYRGRELNGKTLGIVGLGRVGGQVARYGRAFGMNVVGYDPWRVGWPPEVTRVRDLTDLLAAADVLTLHVPLNEETRGLLQASAFHRMNARSLLVNTSRGELVDEAALLDALRRGTIGGAALDVIAGERNPAERSLELVEYLRSHDNLIVTPHVGGATEESMARTELFIAHKLKEWLGARAAAAEVADSGMA